MYKKHIIHYFLLAAFTFSTFISPVYGQNIVDLVQSPAQQVWQPLAIKGISFDWHNPFQFDFILDTGNTGLTDPKEIEKQSHELVEYFLLGLTVPQKDLWVNLSVYEENRILPENLNKTAIGKNFLEQDYLLKKLTSTLTMPNSKEGEKLWQEIYKKIQKLFGTSLIPVDILNKVWIVPGEAEVVEYKDKAFITKATLKVMLETDYFALQKSDAGAKTIEEADQKAQINKVSAEAMRNEILPLIEREVNTSKEFAPLRQLYYSLILAVYCKNKLRQSIHYVFVNQNKTNPLKVSDPAAKERVYNEYMDLYKKGVADFIKKEVDPATHKTIKRRYVSGGTNMGTLAENTKVTAASDPIQASSALYADIAGILLGLGVNLIIETKTLFFQKILGPLLTAEGLLNDEKEKEIINQIATRFSEETPDFNRFPGAAQDLASDTWYVVMKTLEGIDFDMGKLMEEINNTNDVIDRKEARIGSNTNVGEQLKMLGTPFDIGTTIGALTVKHLARSTNHRRAMEQMGYPIDIMLAQGSDQMSIYRARFLSKLLSTAVDVGMQSITRPLSTSQALDLMHGYNLPSEFGKRPLQESLIIVGKDIDPSIYKQIPLQIRGTWIQIGNATGIWIDTTIYRPTYSNSSSNPQVTHGTITRGDLVTFLNKMRSMMQKRTVTDDDIEAMTRALSQFEEKMSASSAIKASSAIENTDAVNDNLNKLRRLFSDQMTLLRMMDHYTIMPSAGITDQGSVRLKVNPADGSIEGFAPYTTPPEQVATVIVEQEGTLRIADYYAEEVSPNIREAIARYNDEIGKDKAAIPARSAEVLKQSEEFLRDLAENIDQEYSNRPSAAKYARDVVAHSLDRANKDASLTSEAQRKEYLQQVADELLSVIVSDFATDLFYLEGKEAKTSISLSEIDSLRRAATAVKQRIVDKGLIQIQEDFGETFVSIGAPTTNEVAAYSRATGFVPALQSYMLSNIVTIFADEMNAYRQEIEGSASSAMSEQPTGGIAMTTIEGTVDIKELEQMDCYAERIAPFLDKIDVPNFRGYSYTIAGVQKIEPLQFLEGSIAAVAAMPH